MKTTIRLLNFMAFGISALGFASANATLTPGLNRGEALIEIAVPGKRPEVCVVPKHFPGGKYSEKDLENEKELCAMNEYENIAICPKLESTNPGLNFHEVPKGMSISQVEAANCNVPNPKDPKDSLAGKEAKYKLSTSCSYTPAIIGYYHMSRILGDIVNVPQAVIRTFDLERHVGLGIKAMKLAKDGDTIELTWKSLLAQLQSPSTSKKKDILFTDDLDQSFGALSKNPKKETKYKDMFNGGPNNVERAKNFRDKSPFFAMVSNRAAASSQVGREFNQKNVQLMVQMKDVSDFLLLDAVMNQEDRFGNIHAETKFYYFEKNDKGETKLKSKKKLKKEEIAQLNAVEVREMLLKDNDCGVARTDVIKPAGLIEKISHVDPKTYKRLLKLDSVADTEEVSKFFKLQAMFTASDWSAVRANLKKVATILKAGCVEGRVKLDLDVDAHFEGQAPKAQSCDI